LRRRRDVLAPGFLKHFISPLLPPWRVVEFLSDLAPLLLTVAAPLLAVKLEYPRSLYFRVLNVCAHPMNPLQCNKQTNKSHPRRVRATGNSEGSPPLKEPTKGPMQLRGTIYPSLTKIADPDKARFFRFIPAVTPAPQPQTSQSAFSVIQSPLGATNQSFEPLPHRRRHVGIKHPAQCSIFEPSGRCSALHTLVRKKSALWVRHFNAPMTISTPKRIHPCVSIHCGHSL
jgi:hypothetical protein